MSNTKEVLANNEINFPRVQVLTPDGEHKGSMATHAALQLAQLEGLDLIVIDANQKPPVCKIMDFGKFMYDRNKKNHIAKQKTLEVKEIQLTPRIESHDLEIKIRKMNEFLNEGHRVKILMRLKGRESSHLDITQNIWQKIEDNITGHFTERPKNEFNKSVIVQVAPGKLVPKAKANSRSEETQSEAQPVEAHTSSNSDTTVETTVKPTSGRTLHKSSM